AAVLAAAAREHVVRQQSTRGAREQGIRRRHLLDRVEQLLLGDLVFGDRLDDPFGVLYRLQQAPRLLELEEPPLDDSLRRPPERHQRARPPWHVRGGPLEAPRAGVETVHRPSGGSAEGAPATPDIPTADDRDFARHRRHTEASSRSIGVGAFRTAQRNTRSDRSGLTTARSTWVATLTGVPAGSTRVCPRCSPSSRSTTRRRSSNPSAPGF